MKPFEEEIPELQDHAARNLHVFLMAELAICNTAFQMVDLHRNMGQSELAAAEIVKLQATIAAIERLLPGLKGEPHVQVERGLRQTEAIFDRIKSTSL